MANLRKTNQNTEATEVKVDVTPAVEPQADVEVTPAVAPNAEENTTVNAEENENQTPTEDIVPTVDVEVTPAPADVAPVVDVDTTPVDNSTQATAKTVRIRMRDDHSFWVNNEHFNFKKGQCYNVSPSVKKRLNKAGVLSPL